MECGLFKTTLLILFKQPQGMGDDGQGGPGIRQEGHPKTDVTGAGQEEEDFRRAGVIHAPPAPSS